MQTKCILQFQIYTKNPKHHNKSFSSSWSLWSTMILCLALWTHNCNFLLLHQGIQNLSTSTQASSNPEKRKNKNKITHTHPGQKSHFQKNTHEFQTEQHKQPITNKLSLWRKNIQGAIGGSSNNWSQMIIIDNPKSHQNVYLTHKTNPPTKQKPNTPKNQKCWMKWNAYILPNQRDQKIKYGVKEDDKFFANPIINLLDDLSSWL